MPTTIQEHPVITSGDPDIPLSKNQLEFNRLSKRIDALKRLIETDRLRMDALHAAYMKLIPPLAERDARLRLELARILAAASFRYKWPKNELGTLSEAVAALCEQVFAVLELSDEEMAFYRQWSKTSLDEEEDMSGMETEIIADGPVDGPSEDWQQEADYSGGWNQTRERKKSRKTLEKEQREQELLAMQQKSIRSVYLALAKVLHPDTATSEDERLQKEELIKLVTGAYQNRDLPALLLLESEWVAKNADYLAGVDDVKLAIYISSLKDQLRLLKTEHAGIFEDPKYLCVLEYSQVSEKKALQHIRLDAANRKRLIRDMELGNRSLKKGTSRKEILDLATQFFWQSSTFDDWGTDENGQRTWDEWNEEELIQELIT